MFDTPLAGEATERDALRPIPAPKWVPFCVVLGLVLLLLITPFVVSALSPAPIVNKVGLFQRYSLEAEHDGGEAIGGFIGPQGWFEANSSGPRQKNAEEKSPLTSYTFVSPDHRDSIVVELHGDVASPVELLQSQTPIAATLVPNEVLPSVAGLEIAALDVDLRAGAGSTQFLIACRPGEPSACLLITSKAQAWLGDPRFGQRQKDGVMLPEVREMLSSLEVYS